MMSDLQVRATRATATVADGTQRVAILDWPRITNELHECGAAVVGPLLSPDECETLIGLYPASEVFRSRVVMQRHGFGRGEYQYFAYPLPPIVSAC